MRHQPAARNQRCIQLDDKPETPPVTPQEFYQEYTVDTDIGHATVIRQLEDDFIVVKSIAETTFHHFGYGGTKTITTVEKIPRYVDFDWIKLQVKVEDDYDVRMPWEDCDGWEHQLETYHDSNCPVIEVFKKSRGYIGTNHGIYTRVVMTDKSYAGETIAQRVAALRHKGASKQVAREVVAAQNRHYISALVKWHIDGYQCYYVATSFFLAGRHYTDSCGGYDDANYGVTEIANSIASQMQADWFIVGGFDPQRDYKIHRHEHKVRRLAYNLNMFNWDEK